MKYLYYIPLYILLCPFLHHCLYTSEPTVKLLEVDLFGSTYPAAVSEYRIDVNGGKDEEIDRNNLEQANNYPEFQLVLSPGGSATYEFPYTKDDMFIMIKPGKKTVEHGSPFKEKANITVSAINTAGEKVEASCSKRSSDSSSEASDYCVLSIESIALKPADYFTVAIMVPEEETRDAAIWQVHIGPLDDSRRVEGTFNDEARHRLRKTQESEDFNTWLTMVSIVGKTGVGKSTVASLISGNDTMFVAKSSSSGTTTLGADMSTIIPSSDYRMVLEPILDSGSLYEPKISRPLFLIDSEGMAFRGDEVDFVTTGPVAIIANIIVWITNDRLRPSDILEDIRDYLKGLDRISMGNKYRTDEDYGEFIVVLNKMQDTSQTDEGLCDELMEYGSSTEDDQTRDDLYDRFQDIACVGLPMIHLNEGEDFGYPVLTPRFREGLYKLSNRILSESESPRNVRVGSQTYEMNSTEAETIIGMLISGANEGNIDLTDPCNVLYSINEEKVIQALGKTDEEIEKSTKGKCDAENGFCSTCVCEYKNAAAESLRESLSRLIDEGISTANSLCEANIGLRIGELIGELVNPWYEKTKCLNILESSEENDVCDLGDLMKKSTNIEDGDIERHCSSLFMCGSITIPDSELLLETENVFLSPGTELIMAAPAKGSDGQAEGAEGEEGEQGGKGGIGKSIKLIVDGVFLTGSESQITVSLYGGDGGDGGRGGSGKPGIDGTDGAKGVDGVNGKNGVPGHNGTIHTDLDTSQDASTCTQVISNGSPTGGEQHCCTHDHCGFLGGWECRTATYWQEYAWSYRAHTPCTDIDAGSGSDGTNGSDGEDGQPGTDGTNGHDGGKGGRGGDGGKAGEFEVVSNLSITAIVHRIGGKGGIGGLGGKGGKGSNKGLGGMPGRGGDPGFGGEAGYPGYGQEQERTFLATKHRHTSHHCHGFLDVDCSISSHDDACDGFKNGDMGNLLKSCTGSTGKRGADGVKGKDGLKGKDGVDGLPGKDGEDGQNGQDA